MKFTITTAVLYLLLKLVFYRAAYNPSCSLLKLSGVNPNYRTHMGVPQSDSVNTTSCTHNINHTPHLHSFTVFDIVLGFNLVHFNEYDVCRAVSWHSVSFNESAVSMIISKQTVLHAAHIPVTFSKSRMPRPMKAPTPTLCLHICIYCWLSMLMILRWIQGRINLSFHVRFVRSPSSGVRKVLDVIAV